MQTLHEYRPYIDKDYWDLFPAPDAEKLARERAAQKAKRDARRNLNPAEVQNVAIEELLNELEEDEDLE